MSMYVERTNYYAKPGRAAAVLAVRSRASRVRQELGLAPGTTFVKQDEASDGPDVQWECEFESLDAHDRDLATRAASPAFEAVRAEMRTLVDRFERHLVRRDGSGSVRPRAQSVSIEDLPIVPSIEHFRSGAATLTGYLHRPPGQGPFPCVVTNHGSTVMRGGTDLCRPSVAALLLSWGIASFLPHRRGYGESPGTPWREAVPSPVGSEAYDAELTARLQDEAKDVVAALEFLRGRSDIRSDHVAVMGSSFGGTVTLLAAAMTDGFRCAIDFAGAAMNWDRAPRLRAAMTEAALRLTSPILLVQAANDYSTAPTEALSTALRDAGKSVEARIFPAFGLSADEGHAFERAGTMVWGAVVRRFLERHL